MSKGTMSRISHCFQFKTFTIMEPISMLLNHSSYELETWHEYSFIILLYLLQITSPPISGVGRASMCRSCSKLPYYALLWRLTAQGRRLLTLNLRNRRPKQLINQVRSLGLLRPWNGDSLKSGKKSRFA